jgi:large subunit ribosomal protein L22
MQATATAKFIRYTPRKINQVLSLIRGKSVLKAVEILSFLPKSAATVVDKVVKSAVANTGVVKDASSYTIKEAWVGAGPTLKRMRTGPKGRGMPVKKRMAHLTVVVTDEIPIVARKKKKEVSGTKTIKVSK